MIKHCPIMSGREKSYSEKVCIEKECAWWDEKRSQCCILTQTLAAAADPLDKIREQAMYVPDRPTTGVKPQHFYYNDKKTGDVDLADQYIFNGGL